MWDDHNRSEKVYFVIKVEHSLVLITYQCSEYIGVSTRMFWGGGGGR